MTALLPNYDVIGLAMKLGRHADTEKHFAVSVEIGAKRVMRFAPTL